MSTAAAPEGSNERSGRWQVSLADLIIMVLAAGVAAGIARGSRDVWGTRLITPSGGAPVPVERTAGLVLEVMAVFLIFILARTVLGLIRQGRSESGRRIDRVRAMAWRIVAVALLMDFVAEEWNVLRMDYLTMTSPSMRRSGWEPVYRVRESLFPICGLLAMLGLTLGMGAGVVLEGPTTRRPRPYWLFVPLAALAGLLLVAQPSWWSLIPQLVLVALQAVSNAMFHSLVRTPSISTRLLRAGIDASVACLVCLTLALIVAHDFERARRSEPWAMTRSGWLVRLFSLIATMAAGTYVGLVSIRTIHPYFADGFRDELGPVEVSMLLCGFGLFAAGLAARSIGGLPARERPRWLVRLSFLLQLGILSLVLFSALKYLPSSTQFEPGVPPVVGRLVDGVGGMHLRLWRWIPDPIVDDVQLWLAPDRLVWTLTLLALTMLVIEISLTSNAQQALPFHAVAQSPAQAVRFLWLTVGFTVVCLAAVPIFIVSGQTLVHIQLRGADWPVFGWPRVF